MDEQMTPARDLKAGDLIDLAPAFRTFPIEDEATELTDGVHWSLYELATLERDADVTPMLGRATLTHTRGVFDLPADFLVPVHGNNLEG